MEGEVIFPRFLTDCGSDHLFRKGGQLVRHVLIIDTWYCDPPLEARIGPALLDCKVFLIRL